MPASNLAEGHTNKERCEVSNAKELAKEIADELYKFGWIDQRWVNIYSQANLERHLERVIATKLEPLVDALEQSHEIVVDAIMHGMPITKKVAKARNDAVAILGKRGDQ